MKPPLTILTAIIWILCVSVPGGARALEPDPYSDPPRPCLNAYTTAAQLDCAQQNLERAENRMNELLNTVLTKATPEEREHYKAAQEAWETYRHHVCQASVPSGGTIRGPNLAHCLAEMAIMHAETIHTLIWTYRYRDP
ncbi:lysozyme inhibitor LprI family protein [Magnetovibrio sp. PR-2]|uniref:lysozyme inhibitor LprI family protein n=1 Tax=Magnetovibrio sp. PR-2 TaxID=3120356 RepID=UPI002FCE1B5C